MSNQTTTFSNWNAFYQRYVLIFNVIVVISLVPFGWMYLQLEHGLFQPYFSNGSTQWIGAGVMLPIIAYGLLRSYKDAQKNILAIPRDFSVRNKLANYYKLQMRKFVIYEMMAIVSLVGMLIFQPIVFAIFYIFILFVFSLDWPKYVKVVEHLRLSKEEQEVLATSEVLPK
jgi:hypothetical protein